MRNHEHRDQRARRQGGSALILALLFMTVLAILMLALANTRVSEARIVSSNVQLTQAHLIAEAGVDLVLATIVRDGGILPTSDPLYAISQRDFGEGRLEAVADLDPTSGRLRITSTGWDVRQSRRTIEVLLELRLTSRETQDYALFTCGDLLLTGNMAIADGGVYSGSNLTIVKSDAVINGSASAKGNVVFDGNGSVTGDVISVAGTITSVGGPATRRRASGYAANPLGNATLTSVQALGGIRHDAASYDLPDYCEGELRDALAVMADDFAAYRAEAIASATTTHIGDVDIANGGSGGYQTTSHYIDGNLTITGTPAGFDPFDPDAVYFIEGDMVVEGNFDFQGPATFVVMGSLEFRGGASLTDPEFGNVFIVDGDVFLDGNSVLDGFVYTNGTINGAGTSTINGGAMSMSTLQSYTTGTIDVNYRQTRDDWRTDLVMAGFDIQRWRLLP